MFWPAAYVLDVARLYRLAIEKAERNATYNAVAEEGVPMRDIAEAIGRRLKLPAKSIPPEEAESAFRWLAHLAARDMPASSAQTRRKLGWAPTGPGLIADLEQLRVEGRWRRGSASAITGGFKDIEAHPLGVIAKFAATLIVVWAFALKIARLGWEWV